MGAVDPLVGGNYPQLCQIALVHGDIAGVGALVSQQVFGDALSLPFLADAVGSRHADVVEELLVEDLATVDDDDRLDSEVGRFEVDQRAGNAMPLFVAEIGAYWRKHAVSAVGRS